MLKLTGGLQTSESGVSQRAGKRGRPIGRACSFLFSSPLSRLVLEIPPVHAGNALWLTRHRSLTPASAGSRRAVAADLLGRAVAHPEARASAVCAVERGGDTRASGVRRRVVPPADVGARAEASAHAGGRRRLVAVGAGRGGRHRRSRSQRRSGRRGDGRSSGNSRSRRHCRSRSWCRSHRRCGGHGGRRRHGVSRRRGDGRRRSRSDYRVAEAARTLRVRCAGVTVVRAARARARPCGRRTKRERKPNQQENSSEHARLLTAWSR